MPFDELLRRALADDQEALARLSQMASDYLAKQGHIKVRRPLEAVFSKSDAAQETLVLVFHKLDSFRGSTEPEWYSWIESIAGNVVKDQNRMATAQKRDVRRSEALEVPIEADQSTPSNVVARTDSFDQLKGYLEHLPPDQCTALKMRYIEDATVAEIAVRMAKSEDAVAGLLRRALATTREKAKRRDPDYRA